MLGLRLGIAWLVTTPKIFEATVALELTSVAPQVNISSVGARPDPVTIDTDAQIVTSDAVVNAVTQTPPETTQQTSGRTSSVSARPLTQVMTITYTSRLPAQRRVDGAIHAARAFLAEKERLIVEPVRNYLTGNREPEMRSSRRKRGLAQRTRR